MWACLAGNTPTALWFTVKGQHDTRNRVQRRTGFVRAVVPPPGACTLLWNRLHTLSVHSVPEDFRLHTCLQFYKLFLLLFYCCSYAFGCLENNALISLCVCLIREIQPETHIFRQLVCFWYSAPPPKQMQPFHLNSMVVFFLTAPNSSS